MPITIKMPSTNCARLVNVGKFSANIVFLVFCTVFLDYWRYKLSCAVAQFRHIALGISHGQDSFGDDDFGDFDDGLQQGEDDAETSFDKPPEQPPVPVPSPGPVSRSNSSPHILLPCPPAMVIV